MFQLIKVQNQNNLLDYYQLQNKEVSCKIYPNLGASLQQFSIQDTEIIQGIQPVENDLTYFRRYYPSSFLFPFPGRIAGGKYEYEGIEYQLQSNETGRDNAIHGFIAEVSFQLTEQELDTDVARLNFEYFFQGNEEGFPFPAKINIIYQISADSLKINIIIENTGDKSFPFALGWHPYFLSQDLTKSKLYFQSKEQLTVDEYQIPTGTEPIRFTSIIEDQQLDHTYLLEHSKVQFSTQKYEMGMDTFSTKKDFLQLYTPPDRASIAIEPMTCTPDVFNNKNGLLELTPNEVYNWSINLDFKMLA